MSDQIKCRECGRPIPDDEAQVVHDQIAVYCKPLADVYGWPVERIMANYAQPSGPVENRYCAACFTALNKQWPLSEFMREMAKHPTKNPTLYKMVLLRKGERHVNA